MTTRLGAESVEIEPNVNLLMLLLTSKGGIGALTPKLPTRTKRLENSSLGMKLPVSKQRMGQIEEPLIEWSSPNMRSDWSKELGHHDGFRIATTTMPLRRIKGRTTPSAIMFINQKLLWYLPTRTHFPLGARRAYNRLLCCTCIYLLFCTKYHPINPY